MTICVLSVLLFAAMPAESCLDGIDAFGSAKWISAKTERGCNPAFAREFDVPKPVKRATLCVCGLGYCIAMMNGVRVGRNELDPVPSDYCHRVYYSTFDVAGLLNSGTNRIDVLLGRGWYDFDERDEWNFDKAPWRGRPRLLARLLIEFSDGGRRDVVTDGSWRRVGSPVWHDAVRSGIEEDGPAPDVNDPVAVVDGPPGRLEKCQCPPTRVMRTMKPVKTKNLGGGGWLFDFGEEIAGRVRLRMRGLRRGDLVKVRHDERVGTNFMPATNRVIDAYFRSAGREMQTDYHHASGLKVEEFAPRFTYKGFRYVLVTGAREPLSDGDVVAEEMHSAFGTTGDFECSDEDFNAMMRMADRSYRANYVNGIPTDCPHREKNGWTGDANAACEFAQYRYDNAAAYVKWLRDIVDAQRPDGQMPGIVPTSGWGYSNYGTIWDGAIVEIPNTLYRHHGDILALKEFYPAMKRSVDGRLQRQMRPDGTFDEGPGDWCSPGHATANGLVSTAWFYGTVRALASIARRLGESDDMARYEVAAAAMRESYNRAFHLGGGSYVGRTQTAQALSLHFGLVPEKDREAALTVLLDSVRSADFHFDCGLLGFSTVFRVLSENGHADVAYRMLTQRTRPSFIAQRDAGATALWEDFDEGFSRCHVMFADFAAWAYAYLAGIRGVEDGFRRFLLAPQVVGPLDYVRASVKTRRGMVGSSWKREKDGIRYLFIVPTCLSATIRLPGRSEVVVQNGTHEYFVPSIQKRTVE